MTHSRAHIMRSAWRIARQGARRYGGRARTFFRAALRLAWSRARSLVNKITYVARKLLTRARHVCYAHPVNAEDTHIMYEIFFPTDGIPIYRTRFKLVARLLCRCFRSLDWAKEGEGW